MLIRIQLFTFMLIRIHGAKPNADPHPGLTVTQTVGF
jgi:hypothetical protein